MHTLQRYDLGDLADVLAVADVAEGGGSQPSLQVVPTLAVTCFTRFEDAADAWFFLEATGSASVYQRHDWCKVWFETFHGGTQGMGAAQPLIVVVSHAARPVLLLPLYSQVVLPGLRRARFMGDKHTNVRMPLMSDHALDRAAIMAKARDGGLVDLIGEALADGRHADYLALECAPLRFAGDDNPLALGPSSHCSGMLFAGALHPDFEALTQERRPVPSQRKMRKRFRQLESIGPFSFEKVTDAAALEQALDVFFTQKATRLDQAQVYNAFDDAQNERFIRALAKGSLEDDSHTLDLYTLRVNDAIIAVAGGGVQGDRFSMAINSMSADPLYEACSAGRISIDMAVERFCAEGIGTFDLGLGDNEYKRMWCEEVPLVEVARALTGKGRLLEAGFSLRQKLSALVRRSPAATRLVKRILFHLRGARR